MKPVAFEYARPTTVAEALAMLAARPDAVALAGGQTLGPMLNLRLAQPSLIVDITRIAELAALDEEPGAVVIGASVTHAAISSSAPRAMRQASQSAAGSALARLPPMVPRVRTAR